MKNFFVINDAMTIHGHHEIHPLQRSRSLSARLMAAEGLFQRNAKREDASFACFAHDPDAAAIVLNYLTRYGKSESRTFDPIRQHVARPMKPLEDQAQVIVQDPGPRIGHGNSDF
jgi:hypothetical protein